MINIVNKNTVVKPKKATKTAKEITGECLKELSDQAVQIKKQENKLKERMSFDNDRAYFFSIVFKNSDDRVAFCDKYGIKLHADDFIFIEDIIHLFTKDK